PYYTPSEAYAQTVVEHRNLIDACRNKDVEYACAILRTHLERTKVLSLNSPLLAV
ncbi:MAG: FCD domain-containing protein, partial [Clostridia bacterium]|nr:FCD domain-containing protein [Clostridia bacterium]